MTETDTAMTNPMYVRNNHGLGRDVPSLYIHADAAFRMGTAHEREGTPCQDYGLAEVGGFPFAVISDGCSSSGRTDIGARLLVLAARSVLLQGDLAGMGADDALDALRERTVAQARASMSMLGLAAEDMDATLGVVQAVQGGVRAYLLGDGVLAARWSPACQGDAHDTDARASGVPDARVSGVRIHSTVATWAGNMPGYPMYLAEPARLKLFLDGSQAYAAQAVDGSETALLVEDFLIPGTAVAVGVSRFNPVDGLRGCVREWREDEGCLPDVVAVLTDGVGSLVSSAGAGGQMPWGRALGEMMAFKPSRQGRFVGRRLNMAMKAFAREGMRPSDDLSMAAVSMSGGEDAP